MTSDKLRALRIRLRNLLWRRFPQADAITIGLAVNDLVQVAVRESFNLVEMPHADDCVCWTCVHALSADISEHLARMRVAREAAEEHD